MPSKISNLKIPIVKNVWVRFSDGSEHRWHGVECTPGVGHLDIVEGTGRYTIIPYASAQAIIITEEE